MQISCEGQRAVVTAGGSGIGRVISETLAANGAAVFTCDIAPDMVADVRTEKIGAIEADVSDPTAVDRLFGAAVEAMGGVDILINNAGIAGPTARVEHIETDAWDKTIAVNISGQFYCARRAVPLMKAAGRGAIVNISSVAGRLGFPLRLPYATSKFAITGLTKTLATELGPANISVNAILPGYVLNARGERVIKAKAEAAGRTVEETEATILSNISMRTGITEQEIADLALCLCSDSGRHISGQLLGIDGSFETYLGMDNLDD
jgi:NAD(P)-dependent dehydrogenase (short-subunit alcohol dehydrogenase family)